MKNVLAVILGGGRGTRLYPLTQVRSKPAVPIGGKFRLIDIPISNCIHWGIRKIFILTQFNTASLHRHLTNSYKFDSFSRGFIEILAAQQTLENMDWYEGTADAVRKNLQYIDNQDIDYVVILSGDQLYRIDLLHFIDSHKSHKADISIASKPIDRRVAGGFGVLKIDQEKRIIDFAEKPQGDEVLDRLANNPQYIGTNYPENFLASMGIYIFNKKTLCELLMQNDKEDFGKQIIPASIKTHRVFSYIFNGYWEDIGTIRSFFEANLDFANPLPRFNFYDEINPIFTHARFLPGSKIKNCMINHALIAEGSILEGSNISHSVIGIRSVIQEGSTLNRVVMMGADYYGLAKPDEKSPLGIGKNCFIRNAILDKNVCIGHQVHIDYQGNIKKEDRGSYHIVDGLVVVPKDGVIPAKTTITD